MAAQPSSPYLDSLIATRDHLKASITSRDARSLGQSDDFKEVTDRERARLVEVKTEIKKLWPDVPDDTAPSATPAAQP